MFPTHKPPNRVFERLAFAYGRDFTARYEGVDANGLRSLWAHELMDRFLANDLESVAWALEHLLRARAERHRVSQPMPPGAAQGRANPGRTQGQPRSAWPPNWPSWKPMLQPIRDRERKFEPRPARAWAYRLVERHLSGEWRSTPAALVMAAEVLHLDDNERAQRILDRLREGHHDPSVTPAVVNQCLHQTGDL